MISARGQDKPELGSAFASEVSQLPQVTLVKIRHPGKAV
jgi:hypothetical protein